MTSEHRTPLLMLYIHPNIPIYISSAILEFARRHPRQMELAIYIYAD